MSIEALLWGLLPAFAAVATVFASARMAVKARRIPHSLVAIFVTVANAVALEMLFMMFVLGGWPTYLPHVFISVAVVFALVQGVVFSRQRHDAA